MVGQPRPIEQAALFASGTKDSVKMVRECGNRCQGSTYELNLSLATLLDGKGERGLQFGVGILDGEECLMGSLALSTFLRRQDDLERVRRAQGDRGRQRLLRIQSGRDNGAMLAAPTSSMILDNFMVETHCSFVPPVAPFPWTDRVASAKPQDGAPCTTPTALLSSAEQKNLPETCMAVLFFD